MRTTSHSSTSPKSLKNGMSRSLPNFSESEVVDFRPGRRLMKARVMSLPKSSQLR